MKVVFSYQKSLEKQNPITDVKTMVSMDSKTKQGHLFAKRNNWAERVGKRDPGDYLVNLASREWFLTSYSSSMPNLEEEDQVGNRKEQSANRRVVSWCSVKSPKVIDL